MNDALNELLHRAITHHQAGDIATARVLYGRLIQLSPPPLDPLHLLGVTFLQTDEAPEAEKYFRQVLAIDPNHKDCLSNLSVALKRQGKLQEAIEAAEKLIAIAPSHLDGRNNLANILLEAGHTEQALSQHDWLIANSPDKASALCAQAQALRTADKITESIEAGLAACKLNPQLGQAHFEVAQSFLRIGRLDAATASFEQAVTLNPEDVAGHNNLANTYLAQGRTEKARESYETALKHHPTSPELWNNLGNLLKEKKEQSAAIHCFERALECSPRFGPAQANLLEEYLRICSWEQAAALSIEVDNQTANELYHGHRPSEQPFLSIARTTDGRVNLHIAKSWSSFIKRETLLREQAYEHWEKGSVPKLRIGYLSGDFRDHPVAHVFRSFLESHNRDRFEVIAYSYGGDDGSSYAAEVRNLADRFVDLSQKTVVESARIIHEDRVHILVDLMGHTKNNRLAILALRPAPVQASYLGFASTTGADFVDYLIADETVAPIDNAGCFSETLAYLPHCYHPIDPTSFEHIPACTRAEFGLPEEALVLMSLNQTIKLEPLMFERWLNILRQVPKSILWLAPMPENTQQNILAFAMRHGIDNSRIIFAERVETKAQHLRRLELADLYLDPRIYNGHTTTCDALAAGVPGVTLEGPHFASRVSSSSLKAAGLPSLVTHSLNEYERRVVGLLNNPTELADIRAQLKANKASAPLFRSDRLVRDMERLYEQMWVHFCLLQSPNFIRA